MPAFTHATSSLTSKQCGKRIKQIEASGTSATAIFEDGSKEIADLIIGADGARSAVREILLGPEKAALHMSPMVATVGLVQLPADSAQLIAEKHPRFLIAPHPSGDLVRMSGKWFIIHQFLGLLCGSYTEQL